MINLRELIGCACCAISILSCTSPDSSDSGVADCSSPDADGDAFVSASCGGDDCDDAAPLINPAAIEIEGEIHEEVDSQPEGGSTQLAVAPSGLPEIAHPLDDGIHLFGRSESGSWDDEVLPMGEPLDMSLDEDGMAHLLYSRDEGDFLRRRLFHSAERADGWSESEIGSGWQASLDVRGLEPRIAYLGLDALDETAVYIATLEGSVWQVDTVFSPVCGSNPRLATDVVTDAAGAIHVSFASAGCPWTDMGVVRPTPRYATSVDGEWTVEEIASEGASDTDIDVAPDGVVHVVFFDPPVYESEDAGGPGVLYHAWRDATAWEVEEVSPAGGNITSSSMMVDEAGAVHVAVANEEPTVLYLTNASGAWVANPLPDSTIGVSLAVGADAVHLGYGHYAGPGLEYARFPLGAASEENGMDDDCDGFAW
jgi:hypothetical protein